MHSTGIRIVSLLRWWFIPLIYALAVYATRELVPPPAAVAMTGDPASVHSVHWLTDDSWQNNAGQRQLTQQIFDAVLNMIAQAESFVLIDMFLYNAWQGPISENHRALSGELTAALVNARQQNPGLVAVLVTDPINTVYGGLQSSALTSLRAAGVHVVLTDLVKLQDSNPLYSGIWRWLIKPFGNSTEGALLPNPFGDGRVSIRSYLAMANFKANHRKLVIADDGRGDLNALITSANPHDGSSAHRNVALQFDGSAVDDLLVSELAVLNLSGAQSVIASINTAVQSLKNATGHSSTVRSGEIDGRTLQVISESAIKKVLLDSLNNAVEGDRADVAMFYLSHREIIHALKLAAQRGVTVRVLLDVNSDAFGRHKNGVPNRPVAAELVAAGVAVRWCQTTGEQCHAKTLQVVGKQRQLLLLGSGNFTRRNLDDYNLETDIVIRGPVGDSLLALSAQHFDMSWNNEGGRIHSAAYDTHAGESWWLRWQYRFMEASGIGTF